MQITWTDELSVGIKDLDDDHRQLIGMINDLQLAIEEATKPENFHKGKIKRALDCLKSHAESHFEREELYFFQTGYPCQESHRLEHLKLIGRISESAARIHISTDPKDAAEIMQSLCDWLTGHFYLTDRKFNDHFQTYKQAKRASLKPSSTASTPRLRKG